MKILFIYQNYRASYTGIAKSFIREFVELSEGENFKEFEFKPFSANYLLNRIFNRLPGVKSLFFNWQNNKLYNFVRKYKPQLIFVLKGTDLKAETLKRIAVDFPEIHLGCFNPDDPFNNASCKQNIRDCIKYYDDYFIWTKSLLNTIIKAGAQRAHYIPFAVDKNIIYPIDSGTCKYDVCFVGNCDDERKKIIYGLSDILKKNNTEVIIDVFGRGWQKYNGIRIHDQVNGKAYLETIAETKINLNILRKQNKGATNMRTFEITAANGFMMHEKSSEAEEIFISGKEAIYFNDGEDLYKKIDHYLKNDEERLTIKENGYKKAVSPDNLYKARVSYILKHVLKE